jgi:hypothetical protein
MRLFRRPSMVMDGRENHGVSRSLDPQIAAEVVAAPKLSAMCHSSCRLGFRFQPENCGSSSPLKQTSISLRSELPSFSNGFQHS